MSMANASPNARILIRVLMLTLMLSSMSALMFNIVLAEIGREFSLSLSQVSWLTSAYTLLYAFGTAAYGKLADRFKLKNLLTFGLSLFAIGSLIGLFSDSFWMALAGRCVQAAGAGAIPATATLVPIRYFPPERRGSALGMTATGLALGSALGPVVSSLIAGFANWRWLFAVPLLLLATLPFYRKYLGDETGERSKLDWLGGGLLAAAVALLLLGVTEANGALAFGGLAAGALFVARIRTAKEPFVDPSLFRNKAYVSGIVRTMLVSGIGVSLYFLSPQVFSGVHELPPQWIGFAMVPAAIAAALLGRKGGKLADARGNDFLYSVAAALLASCFLLLALFSGLSPYAMAAILVLGNVGQSFMQISMSNAVSRTLPRERAGVGMGLFSMLNFIAQGMATGLYGRLADTGAGRSWNPLDPNPESAVFGEIFLVLALLHLALLAFLRIGRARNKKATEGKVGA